MEEISTAPEANQITLADRLQDHAKNRIKDELTGFFREIPEAVYSYYLTLVGIYTTADNSEFTKIDDLVGEANALLQSELKAAGIKITIPDFKELTQIIKTVARSEIDVKRFRERQEKADNTGWNTRQYIDFLANLGYTFKLNVLDDSLEVNGETTNTYKEAKIHNILSDSLEKNVSDSRFKRILKECALDNKYHPIIRYLERVRKRNALGVIDKLSNHFRTNDDELFKLYLKNWFVGAVERAYTGKQNPMLVLDGKQGIGKSWFTKWIAPAGYYLQSPIKPDTKDCQMNLNNFFVWEVSELGSTTRKADVEALKDFITREFNVVRKPYEPENTKKKVLANFIGTINNEAGFLRDATGNRRFHVITVDSIDFRYQQIPIDDLWSEAAFLYAQGFKTELTPEQQKRRDDMNQQYMYKTHLDEVLENYLTITHNDQDRISSVDLTRMIAELGVRENPNKITKAVKMYLGYFGIEKTVYKQRGKAARGYKGVKINYE